MTDVAGRGIISERRFCFAKRLTPGGNRYKGGRTMAVDRKRLQEEYRRIYFGGKGQLDGFDA